MIKNLDKINKCKKEKIRAGLEYVNSINSTTPVIDKIIIFGSSITDNCTEESDIDICLFPTAGCDRTAYLRMRGKLMDVIDDICDILIYSKLNNDWKEIIDHGVIVYER